MIKKEEKLQPYAQTVDSQDSTEKQEFQLVAFHLFNQSNSANFWNSRWEREWLDGQAEVPLWHCPELEQVSYSA